MKDKKGFTLIELLAVVLVLGLLITLIAPKVVSTLKESEKKTNLTSAQNLIKAAQLKASNNELTGTTNNIKINYQTGENINYLDYSGTKPEIGQVQIKTNGDVAMAVKFGDYCYLKPYNSNDITTIVYNENTCGANSDIFINYTMPDLAVSGDGLYEALGEPGRYIYRGSNPNNHIYLKENHENVLYKILSYENDGTIKVVRDSEITKDSSNRIKWDNDTDRRNTASGYYCNTSAGCNVWGNQTNTYYNDKTLSELGQDFYFYYYPDNGSVSFSIKPSNNYGIVTTDSSLNTYLNNTWINTLDFKNSIDTHAFYVGGVFYYNTFNNGYSGGDKGLLKEKGEEQVYTWNGKIALMNITEFVETSLSDTCTSVYSNYYYQPNNVTQTGTSSTTAKYSNGDWPCAKQNWNYKSTIHQWFLSAYPYSRNSMWFVDNSGAFYSPSANNANVSVRPAFYLKSSVKLGGLGTQDTPYYLIES